MTWYSWQNKLSGQRAPNVVLRITRGEPDTCPLCRTKTLTPRIFPTGTIYRRCRGCRTTFTVRGTARPEIHIVERNRDD